jgi:hypothetical protein
MTPTAPSRSDAPILRLLAVAFVALVGLFTVGMLLAYSSGPPGSRPSASVARAAVIPNAPAGRRLFLAPLGDFPNQTVRALANFYRDRYGLQITILEPAGIDPGARDQGRGQLVGEDLITSMQASYPAVAGDPKAVVIGLVTEDLYIRARPDWDWAFGLRDEDRFAVVSTARMGAEFGFSDKLATSRLRKMVARDIGVLYYGLTLGENPNSVLYREVLGSDDLDRMGEDF